MTNRIKLTAHDRIPVDAARTTLAEPLPPWGDATPVAVIISHARLTVRLRELLALVDRLTDAGDDTTQATS
jgi:hypothetical protein